MTVLIAAALLCAAPPESASKKKDRRVSLEWVTIKHKCKGDRGSIVEERMKKPRIKRDFIALSCNYRGRPGTGWTACRSWGESEGGYRLKDGLFEFSCKRNWLYRVLVGYEKRRAPRVPRAPSPP